MDEPPTITILLLGDASCGKSTFLSRLCRGPNSAHIEGCSPELPCLRDIDQPVVFDIRMYNRPYRFEFYHTASPNNYSSLRPDFVVICFAIDDRQSLANAPAVWRKDVKRNYTRESEDIPIMLLGLKRDRRVEGPAIIYPQEGYRIAQEMCCDRYGECSALTGELMDEVFEDIAKTAAKTTTEAGALSRGACNIM